MGFYVKLLFSLDLVYMLGIYRERNQMHTLIIYDNTISAIYMQFWYILQKLNKEC